MKKPFLRMTDLDLGGKRVLIRADLNVPQDDEARITDDTRIRASLAGIRAAVDAGAAVMVMSHLGRPKEGEFREIDSLAPVATRLGELLGSLLGELLGELEGLVDGTELGEVEGL